MLIFENAALGISFPFPIASDDHASEGIGDIKSVRAAFPKYLVRRPYFTSAKLVNGNEQYILEIAENINHIATKTLEDRMLREFSNSLLCLGVKQLAEYKVRQQNEELEALFSMINAASEKAYT